MLSNAEYHLMTEFALRHNLTPKEAVVLVALFENAAQKANMTIGELLRQCPANKALDEYMACCARRVINNVLGE